MTNYLNILKLLNQNQLIYGNPEGFFIKDLRESKGDNFFEFDGLKNIETIDDTRLIANSKDKMKIFDVRKQNKNSTNI